MSDSWTVRLIELEVFGRHGVFDEEQELGQRFIVDLEMALSSCAGSESDRLEDTVDYGTVSDRVARVVAGPSVRLIERLASQIADVVLAEDPRITEVTVTVRKPHVAISHTITESNVTLRRTRTNG